MFTRQIDREDTIVCFNERNHIRSLKLESHIVLEDIVPAGMIFTGSDRKELKRRFPYFRNQKFENERFVLSKIK